MSKFPRSYQRFKNDHPKVWQAYEALGAAAAEEGPLNAKVRELVKLGMAATNQSESAVISHTHRALEIGATVEEIDQAILLGITTIGFPAMMAALSWAHAAQEAHQNLL